MRLLILSIFMTLSFSVLSQTTDIMSSPFNNSYIGFKLNEIEEEDHKFFLEYRYIKTSYKELYNVLKAEFKYGVRLVYITSDQRSKGVYIIFHNSLLYETVLSKLRKCIQQYFGKRFKKELEDIAYLGYVIDVAYGRFT